MRILVLLPLLTEDLLKNIFLSFRIHSSDTTFSKFLAGEIAALYSVYKSLYPICEVHKFSYTQNLGQMH